MSWFGTDVMALACIVGGATVSGATTLAMRAHDGHRHIDCAVEARAISPRVVVTGRGGAKTIVVAPNVRLHSRKKCGTEIGEIVEIHVDRHLRHMEEFELQMRDLEIELEGLEKALEFDFQVSESFQPEYAFQFEHQIEAEIEAELQKVFQELSKLKEGGKH